MPQIILVMHQPLATAFTQCAHHVLGASPRLACLDIPADADIDAWCTQLTEMLANHAATDFLLLCDLYGATPFNIAQRAADKARQAGKNVEVLSGTNLNMVIKSLTDPLYELHALAASVRQGGIRGLR